MMTHFRTAVSIVVLSVAMPSLSWGVAITDPGFDASLTSTADASTGASSAGSWIMNNNSWTTATVDGETAATRATNFTRYLVQVVQDDNQATGEQAFSFDYYSIDTNNDNVITPQVYGTNSDAFSIGLTAGGTTELTELYTTFAISNAIKNGAEASKTVGWTRHDATVDLGATGYKYIVIRFIGTEYNTGGAHSDVIAIDNVTLVPEPASVGLVVAALLALPRRRAAWRR